jgi:eukaryotic-like serine/threonine-protein kinase
MTPKRYQRICQLFDEALELPPEQRAAFLDDTCGDDVALRAEVEKFLAGMEPAEDYLARPAMDVAAEILAQQQQNPSVLGQQISHYQIIALLGAGGMGRVFLARDSRLGRQVALKLLPTQYTQDAERVRRFQTEAKAASALNHPNILTIHDVGEAAGKQFIATEYVEGQTLRQLLQRGPVPAAQVIEIALQLTDALAAAHQAGIIHRDIKPDNVMLRPDGYVKVLDFGLAKLTERHGDTATRRHGEEEMNDPQSAIRNPHLTRSGVVMGTISYMSPEQALGQAVDARTDIFSLGVMLYELLTGVQPFRGTSEAATYNAILNHTPPPLTQSVAHLPVEFAGIIERSLEKDRELRYQTAADLRAAFKRLQRTSDSQEAAIAAPPPPSVNHRKWIAVVAASLLALIGGVFGLNKWRKSEPAAPSSTAVNVSPRNVSYAQVTEQAGMEYFPTLSPDGRTLVYASRANGNWDVWQQTVGTHDAVNLTNDAPRDDLQPSFSPDGKQIVFHSERDGGGLFVMDLTTRAVRKINSEGFNPTWSPDGSEIAYCTANLTNIEARAASQIWAVRVDNGARRLIVSQDSVQPAWSPNGKHIAFFGNQPNGQLDLMTIPASGGAIVQLTNDAAVDWNPCWAADGKSLYFTSDRGGNTNLWRIAVDDVSGRASDAPEPFTTPATDTYHLSLSRDGRHIAYVQRTKRRNLFALTLDPNSGNVRGTPRAITRGTGATTHPAISPDGQWLAYSSAGSPQTDIYVMRPDGTSLRQLTNDAAKDHLPRWSPDGKRIAFLSDREGKNESWAVAADGSGKIEQLTFVGSGRAVFPNWSPDGNLLAYTVLRQGSYLIDLRKSWEQQTPQPLTLNGQLEPNLSVSDWSPDGQKIACVHYGADSRHPKTTVYWLATSEAAPRLQTIAEDAEYPTWFSDSQRLLCVQSNKLLFADLRSKTTRSLFTFGEGEIAEYLSLAPDNQTLYYSLSTIEADIWLMKLP